MSPSSGLAVEFAVLCQLLHFGITYDQLSSNNLACCERASTRILMIHRAALRDSKAPDFEGLSVYVSHGFDDMFEPAQS